MERIPDGERIEFENAFYADEGNWIESLLVTARSPFDPESVAGELSRVELFHHERVSDSSVDHASYRLTVVAQEPYPFLLGVILRGTAIPNRLQLHDSSFNGVVTVKEWETFRALAERIEEQFGQFELLRVNQVETTGEPFGSGQLGRVLRNELSQEQLTTLQTAHRLGYFDVPRRASAEDIATELGIAQSTLSERLRLAENRLFDLVFSGSESDPAGDANGG
jgi:hypothetical protein